jgi:hypothetical protein
VWLLNEEHGLNMFEESAEEGIWIQERGSNK